MKSIIESIRPGIEKGFVKPSDVHYGENFVMVGSYGRFETATPRLLFTRVLQLFKEPKIFEYWEEEELNLGGRFTISNKNTKFGIGCWFGQNCVIGGDGFGYERDENNKPVRIPHLGAVVFGNYVYVHHNVNIDRGVTGDTTIGDDTKIDSLTHIAHNVQIGNRNTIAAKCSIEGSVIIGDDNVFGSNVTVLRKVKIGSNCIVGSGSVVVRDVEDNSVMVGNPARLLRKNE